MGHRRRHLKSNAWFYRLLVNTMPWMAHLTGAKAPVFFYENHATENITAIV